jgi:hypothetical protein
VAKRSSSNKRSRKNADPGDDRPRDENGEIIRKPLVFAALYVNRRPELAAYYDNFDPNADALDADEAVSDEVDASEDETDEDETDEDAEDAPGVKSDKQDEDDLRRAIEARRSRSRSRNSHQQATPLFDGLDDDER